MRRLRRSHRDTPGVQLWVVTSVNPDGVEAGTRKNARGVDLNRNFSYRWRGGVSPSSGYYPGPHPFSEPESRAVKRLARRLKPRVTIWYHQPWGQVLAALPRAGPQAEAVRAHRAPAGQTLSRPAIARHRDELAEPPPPGHRVRGRAAGWRAARTRRPGATLARRRRWREAGPGDGSCGPAAAAGRRRRARLARGCGGRRSTATRSPTGMSESGRWPRTRRATTVGAGGACAIPGRSSCTSPPGRATGRHGRRSPPTPPTWVSCPGSAHTSWSKSVGGSTGSSGQDPLPAHDRAEPPLDRDRDGPRGWARLPLGRPPDPAAAAGRYMRRCTSSAG